MSVEQENDALSPQDKLQTYMHLRGCKQFADKILKVREIIIDHLGNSL